MDSEGLQRLLNENLYAGDACREKSQYKIIFETHIPALLPVISDSAYVFGLIFQDVHRRQQDSVWICVRAWWL